MNPKKSVLLITVDCLRQDHVGCYGYNRDTTPQIDKFALRPTTTIYSNAYANGPGTRWALKSIMLGLYPNQIYGCGLPPHNGTCLSEIFSEQGYATGGFVNNGFLTESYHFDRGFEVFKDVSYWSGKKSAIDRLGGKLEGFINNKRIFSLLKRIFYGIKNTQQPGLADGVYGVTDEGVVSDAKNWVIDKKNKGVPFFAWVHFMNAHMSWVIKKKHVKAMGLDEKSLLTNPNEEFKEDAKLPQSVTDSYDVAVRGVDEKIGDLLELVNNDDVVVITGDHGEELESLESFHKASLSENMARVPLLVKYPYQSKNIEKNTAQHIDIPPTVTAAAGISRFCNKWDGKNLDSIDSTSNRNIFLGICREDSDLYGVIDLPWKLIWNVSNDSYELYNLKNDKEEEVDVSEENVEVFQRLKKELERHYSQIKKDRIKTGRAPFGRKKQKVEKEVKESLKRLGYW